VLDQPYLGAARAPIIVAAAVVLLAALGLRTAGLVAEHGEGQGYGEAPEWLRGVVTRSDGETGFLLRVEVVADQTYREAHGSEWAEAASETVMASSDLLNEINVSLEIVDVRQWDSDPAPLRDMLHQAQGDPHREDAVLLAFTSYESMTYPVYDGWTAGGEPAIALKVTNHNEWAVSALVTHEIGHLLGAHHHEDGHDGSSDGDCVMDAAGYRYADRWCDEHRETIAAMLATI